MGSLKKIILPVLAVIFVIILLIILLPSSKKDEVQEISTGNTSEIDWSVLTYTKKDYSSKMEARKVTTEKPEAVAFGVNINFGEYGIEETGELQVKELPVKLDKDIGLKITAYDFKFEEQKVFEDIITIAIPYDEEYVEEGEEEECVGAKYYNEAAGEWEGVLYEVDVDNKQVLIYTTHLSTYGLFQIKDDNTRSAYVTDVYAICKLLKSNDAFQVLSELANEGQTGEAAFKAGFDVINGITGDVGTVLTAATLGGQYEESLVKTMGSAFQHTGLALAAVQTLYDFTYNYNTDAEKMSTVVNLMKNIANNAVGYFGSAALQVGFAGIYVFDVILSTVQSDMSELKLENIGEVYQYYNDIESPRATKEWRSFFIKTLSDNKDNPEKAQLLIEQEIDNFCGRFWQLSYGKQKEIAGVAGKKVMFDQTEDDITVLTEQYKAYLMTRLQAPLTSARNYLSNQAMEEARKELEVQLKKLQKELNKKIAVQITEEPEEGSELQYPGYILRFAPLSADTDIKDWSGIMPESGTLNTSFTILGHMQCGSPNRVEVYEPDGETLVLSVPFKVQYPTTTIILTSKAEAEEEFAEAEAEAEDADKGDYAWILVDTVIEDNKDGLALQNETQEGIYVTEILDASPGSISSKWTYVGETDTYPDPDQLNGESATAQTLFSDLPSVINGDDIVTITITASVTDHNLSFYDSRATGRADLCYLYPDGTNTGSYDRFADEFGKNFIKADTYNDKYSDEAVVSAVVPSGNAKGDKICIEQTGGGVWDITVSYIYEWKAR